jgi:Mrp family chromosome partitioning ATPase
MTLDTIDRAFVARWQARRAQTVITSAPVQPEPVVEVRRNETTRHAPDEASPTVLPDLDTVAEDAPMPVDPPVAVAIAEEPSLIDRLLVAGQEQWECLADEVEVARRDGHRVIAVVGGEPSEGRTTLVDCLARTLRDRGRDVTVLASADDATDLDSGHGNDRRIVLIDAGVWFPPGPIRRQLLVQESVGCDAAILVRRADRDPVAARATALAALGMSVLGEVVTFASPDGDE